MSGAGGWLQSVPGREVADVHEVAVRADQPGDDGCPVQRHRLRIRHGRRADLLRGADRGDPVVADQHGPGRPVVAGHRDDRVLKKQLHRLALQSGRSVQDAGSKISMGHREPGARASFWSPVSRWRPGV